MMPYIVAAGIAGWLIGFSTNYTRGRSKPKQLDADERRELARYQCLFGDLLAGVRARRVRGLTLTCIEMRILDEGRKAEASVPAWHEH